MVLVFVSSWYFVNTVNDQRQLQLPNVKIEDFKWTDGPFPLSGMTEISYFNLTIHNFENNKVENLSIYIKEVDANGTEKNVYFNFLASQDDSRTQPFDGILYANETRTIRGIENSIWGTIGVDSTTAIEVLWGNQTLDQKNFP